MNTHRSGVLALYRATLKQAALLPKKDRSSRLEEIRAGYREHMNAAEPEFENLIKAGFSKLGFLRTITPRLDRRARKQQATQRSYKIRSGETIEGLPKARSSRGVLQNDSNSAWGDVDMKNRMDYHIKRDFMMTDDVDPSLRNGTYVPVMSKNINTLVEESLQVHKGIIDRPDELKQARNSVGSKAGVKRERMRFKHAPWDETVKGSYAR
eukprot:TRINITY_DN6047_c2_g2_i2.p1 TRINITY_DN6047_c2_g2~~TRINITY_DN6047_c2_g2_i2.p1  ORF type:complete len:210 (+),score=29.91 TRINITY_DN6047_c2_g2_i2:38-667(+)